MENMLHTLQQRRNSRVIETMGVGDHSYQQRNSPRQNNSAGSTQYNKPDNKSGSSCGTNRHQAPHRPPELLCNRGTGTSKTCLTQGDDPPEVPLSKGGGLLPVIAIFMVSRGFDKAIRDSGFRRNDADEPAVACSRIYLPQ